MIHVGARILLADDHTIVRHGLRRMLEERPDWQVVAEACDGRQAVTLGELHKPDVAIVDVAMPLLNGIETTRQLVRKVPGVRVLVLSMHVDEVYVTQILRAGAAGYLLKDSADTDLFKAVAAVAQGQSFFSPPIARLMVDQYVRPRPEGVDRYETLSTANARSFSSSLKRRRTRRSLRCWESVRARSRHIAPKSSGSSTCTVRPRSPCTLSGAA